MAKICPPFVTVFFVLCFTKIGGDALAGTIIGIGYIISHFIWNVSAVLLGLVGSVPAYTVVALVFSLMIFVLIYYIHYFITKGYDTRETLS